MRSWRDSRKAPAPNQGTGSGEDQGKCSSRSLEVHPQEAFYDFAIKVGSCLLANMVEHFFIRPAFPVAPLLSALLSDRHVQRRAAGRSSPLPPRLGSSQRGASTVGSTALAMTVAISSENCVRSMIPACSPYSEEMVPKVSPVLIQRPCHVRRGCQSERRHYASTLVRAPAVCPPEDHARRELRWRASRRRPPQA